MRRAGFHFKKRHEQICICRPTLFSRTIDKIVLIAAFLMPLVELPQLFEIYLNKSAENVSLFTWSAFVLFGIPWLAYGIIHKEKPIIILYALWLLVESTIVTGIIIYG